MTVRPYLVRAQDGAAQKLHVGERLSKRHEVLVDMPMSVSESVIVNGIVVT